MSDTIQALALRPDGTHEVIQVARDDSGSTLHGLYAAIGCRSIDLIAFPDAPGGADMWLDDEGLHAETPQWNVLAARLYAHYQGCDPADVELVGTVVMTGGEDEDGETMPLQDETRDFIIAQLGLQTA